VRSNSALRRLSHSVDDSSMDADFLGIEDKRDTRRRAIRMPLFTPTTNLKPMHRLTPARIPSWLARSLPCPVLAIRPRFNPPPCIRSSRAGISWKVESYDRYVLKIRKFIHILFAPRLFHLYGESASA